jgi:soluble lytic murein transglycosylase-like protein
VVADNRWRTLAEMDLRFARSRRRAAKRRGRAVRTPAGWRTTRGLLLIAVVFGLSASVTAVEIAAEAQGPAREKRVLHAFAACPIPTEFRHAFVSASRRTGVSLSLLVAVAYEESRMNPSARSHAGAEGLLQVMPATALEVEADASVPAENVLAGARYLERMLDRFGEVGLALAAYNAGPSAVEEAGGAPTTETLTYVANVQARAASLSRCR